MTKEFSDSAHSRPNETLRHKRLALPQLPPNYNFSAGYHAGTRIAPETYTDLVSRGVIPRVAPTSLDSYRSGEDALPAGFGRLLQSDAFALSLRVAAEHALETRFWPTVFANAVDSLAYNVGQLTLYSDAYAPDYAGRQRILDQMEHDLHDLVAMDMRDAASSDPQHARVQEIWKQARLNDFNVPRPRALGGTAVQAS